MKLLLTLCVLWAMPAFAQNATVLTASRLLKNSALVRRHCP